MYTNRSRRTRTGECDARGIQAAEQRRLFNCPATQE